MNTPQHTTYSFWATLYTALLPVMSLLASLLFSLVFFYPLSSIVPDFNLAILFYWAIHRPTSIPLSIILCIGLFADALSGCFLGLHAFIYLMIWVLLIYQRRYLYNKPFLLNWSVFATIAFIATMLEGLATILSPYGTFQVLHFFVELFATTVSGPLIFKVCSHLNRKFL
ncbi:MAG: rod shape-determining protein MreD [Candidatus Nucleicultricaceae bacterium]